MRKKLYKIIALGGSFDHFHLGHQEFISFAAQFAQRLHIGISDEKLVNTKTNSELIEPFEIRRRAVMSYCQKKAIICQTSKLLDPYGPTLEETQIEALAATAETIRGCDKINEIRTAMGNKALPVHICPWVKDESGEILSSTSIRNGQVNRTGQVYKNILKKEIKLNQTQREFFSKIQGIIVDKPSPFTIHHSPSFVVGDTSLDLFLEKKWLYDLGIYDKRSQRKTHNSYLISHISPDLTCLNHAGLISLQLTKALETCISKKYKHLFVEGEEDLTTVALVLLLPLGSVIYYGQSHEGLVELLVTEEIKNKFYSVLSS